MYRRKFLPYRSRKDYHDILQDTNVIPKLSEQATPMCTSARTCYQLITRQAQTKLLSVWAKAVYVTANRPNENSKLVLEKLANTYAPKTREIAT